jgi:hypothetical protein
MKRWARKFGSELPPETIDEYKKSIGPGWTKRLMESPYTYSGLSISNLARSLGKMFAYWYHTIYSFQSEIVHSADLLNLTAFDEEGAMLPQWQSSSEHVRGTMEIGTSMFLLNLNILNEYIRFGVVMNTLLDGLMKEHVCLVKR